MDGNDSGGLLERVCKQVEHYMSDVKLLLDPKLRAACSCTRERRVPVRALARRQRIRRLAPGEAASTKQIIQLIRQSISGSSDMSWLSAESAVVHCSPLPEIRRLVVKALCPGDQPARCSRLTVLCRYCAVCAAAITRELHSNVLQRARRPFSISCMVQARDASTPRLGLPRTGFTLISSLPVSAGCR